MEIVARYASTCQTVGMNLGYFTSFTVFLAFNDPDFCNKYLRPEGSASKDGILLLRQYMRFWGTAYLIITICVWLFKRENNFQALGSFLLAESPLYCSTEDFPSALHRCYRGDILSLQCGHGLASLHEYIRSEYSE